MNKSETMFANKVDEYLKTLKKEGTLWFLNVYGNAVQRPGIPDRIICYKGNFVAIELKREDGTGEESKRQGIERTLITRAGGISIVADNLDTIKSLFEKIDNES